MENFQKHFDTGRQILQSLISFLTDNCLTASPISLFRWFTISVVLVSLWLAGRGKIFISWVIFACQIRGQKKNVKKKDCDKLSRLGRNKYKASSMPRLLFFVIKTCRVPYGNNFYVRSFPIYFSLMQEATVVQVSRILVYITFFMMNLGKFQFI